MKRTFDTQADEDSPVEDSGQEWTIKRKAKAYKKTMQGSDPTGPAPDQDTPADNPQLQKFSKFRVLPSEGFPTSYDVVVALETELPEIQVLARPNLGGQFVLTPKNQASYVALTQLKTLKSLQVNLQELKPEEKITKAIVTRYPLEMNVVHLTHHPSVVKATRCVAPSTKQETRQVLVHIQGPMPTHLQLGIWGSFQLRLFTPEPLRCYNCQRWGHHQKTCRSSARCGICSKAHATEECMEKLKSKEAVTPKCPSCHGKHHVWNPKCPQRMQRVRALQPTRRAAPIVQDPTTSQHPQPSAPPSRWRLPDPVDPTPAPQEFPPLPPRRSAPKPLHPRPAATSTIKEQPIKDKIPQPRINKKKQHQKVATKEEVITLTTASLTGLLHNFALGLVHLLGAAIPETKISHVVENLIQEVKSGLVDDSSKLGHLPLPKTTVAEAVPLQPPKEAESSIPSTSGKKLHPPTAQKSPVVTSQELDTPPHQEIMEETVVEDYLKSLNLPTEFGKKHLHNESFDSRDTTMSQESEEDLESP